MIGQEISAWSAATYGEFVDGLERKTGKRPALVGVSLLEPGDYDSLTIDKLVDHKSRGGLVTISTHWTHPWGDHPSSGQVLRPRFRSTQAGPFHEMNGPWFWWDPAGLAEIGPAGDFYPRGARALIDRSLDTYPTAIFAHSWYSWTDTQSRALVEQPDITWALNQPQILTLEGVSW